MLAGSDCGGQRGQGGQGGGAAGGQPGWGSGAGAAGAKGGPGPETASRAAPPGQGRGTPAAAGRAGRAGRQGKQITPHITQRQGIITRERNNTLRGFGGAARRLQVTWHMLASQTPRTRISRRDGTCAPANLTSAHATDQRGDAGEKLRPTRRRGDAPTLRREQPVRRRPAGGVGTEQRPSWAHAAVSARRPRKSIFRRLSRILPPYSLCCVCGNRGNFDWDSS